MESVPGTLGAEQEHTPGTGHKDRTVTHVILIYK